MEGQREADEDPRRDQAVATGQKVATRLMADWTRATAGGWQCDGPS